MASTATQLKVLKMTCVQETIAGMARLMQGHPLNACADWTVLSKFTEEGRIVSLQNCRMNIAYEGAMLCLVVRYWLPHLALCKVRCSLEISARAEHRQVSWSRADLYNRRQNFEVFTDMYHQRRRIMVACRQTAALENGTVHSQPMLCPHAHQAS